MLQQPRYIVDAEAREHYNVSIAAGDGKTGKIRTLNLLPGVFPAFANDQQVTNVCGACAGVCENRCENGCYAIRSLLFHHNSAAAPWATNTAVARNNPAAVALAVSFDCRARNSDAFRLHSAGEFLSYEYFCEMAKCAAGLLDTMQRPTIIYTYTKHAEYLARYAEEFGPLPRNFVVQLSQWGDALPNTTNAPEFWYDDGTNDEIAALPHCPAILRPEPGRKLGKRATVTDPKTGKTRPHTCRDCMHCVNAQAGEKWAVYAHN